LGPDPFSEPSFGYWGLTPFLKHDPAEASGQGTLVPGESLAEKFTQPDKTTVIFVDSSLTCLSRSNMAKR